MKRDFRSRVLPGVVIAIAGTVVPSAAASQGATITGTVRSEQGRSLLGANVQIPALQISVGTNEDGVYRIVVASERARGQTVQLRVRAIGFAPQTREITLGPGMHTENFVLIEDINRVTEVVVTGAGTDAKRLAFTVTRDTMRAPGTPSAGGSQSPGGIEEPLERFLFPPELIMRYQQRIGLTDQQRSAITSEIGRLQSAAVEVQWRIADESQKLIEQLQRSPINEAEVLAQIDRITTNESVVKRAQLSMLVRIRNVLTSEQQELLRRLRSGSVR